MLDLIFVTLLTTWAAGVGLRGVSKLGGEPEHPADALALAVPTGLGVLALAVLGLGEVGVLTGAGIAAVMGLGGIVGGTAGIRLIGRWLAGVRRGVPRGAVDLALIVGVVGTLLTALAPVTDGDALCYHLQVPKVFLANRAVGFDPDLHETIYPLTTEMLYAVALAFRGPVACRLIQWVFGLAFAANVTALARPVLGDRARWAGAVAMLAPAVSNGMGAPLNDVALAAFGNAALHAWMRWHDRPSARGAALVGVLAGMAIGVKYPALAWAGLLALAMVAAPLVPTLCVGMPPRTLRVPAIPDWDDAERRQTHSHAGRGNEGWRHAAIFALVAILVGGCWSLRAFHYTSNPVFPFFRHAFGGAGIDEVLDPIKRPMAVTPWNVAMALAPMTLQPDRFDSLAHQFGPAFLLILPGLALLRPPRRVVGIVALGWAFLTACLCVRQSMRFVLIALGPMAVGVAWAASAWKDRGGLPARLIVGVLMAILGAEALLAAARARHGIGVVMGREPVESYLTRREPTYRVGRWIDANLPANTRLVGQDHRGFYLPRPYAMELAHRRRTGLGTRGESAGQIVAALRKEGFTHLLLCPPEPETAVEFDPTLCRRLAPWLTGRAPRYREGITDPDGVLRRYAIYDLTNERSPLMEARR